MSSVRSAGTLGSTTLALVAGLLAASGCGNSTGGTGGGDAGACGDASGQAAWQVVYEGDGLSGALLSVWGSGPHDVYTVGGPLGSAGSAIARHFDGTTWKDLAPGGSATFWWVDGSGPKDVWMVGEHGRITHWDGAAFVAYPPPADATLWGVWPASPTDAWIVGGTPGGGTKAPNDIVLHWDGKTWTPEELPGAPLGRSLNKIWGVGSATAYELYIAGEYGTVWHRKGTTWTLESNPAKSNLLTVFGCSASDVYAVGGSDVLHADGSGAWTRVTDVMLTNSVNGVTCGPSAGAGSASEVLIVGFGGLKQRLVAGAWVNEFDVAPTDDLHGSWSDGCGSFWAAGGDFISPASPGAHRTAALARYGQGQVPALQP
jgi:hypothetical protein